MSFGFGVGDFLAVGHLCWKVYKKCKDSSGNYAELSTEVGALHNVIKETEELLSQQGLTNEQGVKLMACRQGCEDVLGDLNELLIKYESLGTNSRRTFDRMGLGMQDMNGIRLRLISNVTMLDAFNNASSHAKLQNKLNQLIAEVRAGKREGSVVSTKTFNGVAQNDREVWEALRKELEDVGKSPGIITEKRHFIIAWFQEAVAAGKLEEDAPSDDDGSAILLYESNDPVGKSDGESDSVASMKVSSMMIEPPMTKGSKVKESVPNAHPFSGKQDEASKSRTDPLLRPSPAKGKENSRGRVSYLLGKLRGRERQFLDAAMAGDARVILKMLEKGVEIQAQDRHYGADTALHLAAEHGKEETVRLLLSKGADVHAGGGGRETALLRAACSGNEQIIRLLLDKGANIEPEDSYGCSALLVAVAWRQREAVRLLLDKGANTESRDLFGIALHEAACSGDEQIVRLLLDKGANIESKDIFGYTALHQAARIDNKQIIRLLLQKGAKVDSKDANGRTALYYARQHGHKIAVSLLSSAGATDRVSRMDTVF